MSESLAFCFSPLHSCSRVIGDERPRRRRIAQDCIRASTAAPIQTRPRETPSSKTVRYEKMVARHPGDGRLWQRYAKYARKLDGERKGIAVLVRAVRLNPSNGYLWQSLAHAEAERGREMSARRLFARGTRAASSHTPLWTTWATWEAQLGAQNAARALFAVPRPTARHLYAWARFECVTGNTGHARRLLEAGLRLQQDNVYLSQELGDIHVTQSEHDAARRCFERAHYVSQFSTNSLDLKHVSQIRNVLANCSRKLIKHHLMMLVFYMDGQG